MLTGACTEFTLPEDAGQTIDEAPGTLSMQQADRCAAILTAHRCTAPHVPLGAIRHERLLDMRQAGRTLRGGIIVAQCRPFSFPLQARTRVSRAFSWKTCHQHMFCQRMRTWTTGACRPVEEP